jgi:hypothetical protein
MSEKKRFPLAWPHGWPRSNNMRRTPFTHYGKDITISAAMVRLENEITRLCATEPLLSSNLKISMAGVPYSGQAEPADRGIALYFKLKGKDRVLACDKYDSAAGNIAGIAAHIDALRRIDRYGVGTVEQAFAGYAALPPPSMENRAPWRGELGFRASDHVTPDIVQARYRALARQVANAAYADHADDAIAKKKAEAGLLRLNLARDAAMQELGPP